MKTREIFKYFFFKMQIEELIQRFTFGGAQVHNLRLAKFSAVEINPAF